MEKCEDKFRKDCFIAYRDVAASETVEVCDEEVRRDCQEKDDADEGEGARTVCSTQYQTGEHSRGSRRDF